MFTLHRPIDYLVEAGGGSAGLLGSGIAVLKLWLRRGLGLQRVDRDCDEQKRGAADQGESEPGESGE